MNAKALSLFGLGLIMMMSACASSHRKAPEPIVQKPRDLTSLYFASDQSNLQSEERRKLSPTVDYLRRHPSWIAQLEGHADAIGDSAYNLRLGDKRARTIKELLVLAGVAPEQLIVLSFGEEKPVASNSHESGRSRNRRVEIKIR